MPSEGLSHAIQAADDVGSQRADTRHGYRDDVAVRQAERRGRHQAGTGRQHYAVGMDVGSHQVAGEIVELAVQRGRTGLAVPGDRAVAPDRQLDGQTVGVGDLPGGADRRTERAAAQVDLRLRQVERVLALDRPGRHVVAHGVAGDLAEAVDDQGDLGFRDVDHRVGTYRYRLSVADHPPGRRLEEQLGPFGVIDLLVDVSR